MFCSKKPLSVKGNILSVKGNILSVKGFVLNMSPLYRTKPLTLGAFF